MLRSCIEMKGKRSFNFCTSCQMDSLIYQLLRRLIVRVVRVDRV